MKKVIFKPVQQWRIVFSSFIVLTLSLNLSAQLKVTNQGKIGIGTNSPSIDLEINRATTKFCYSTYQNPSPILLKFYYSNPEFMPEVNHEGYLGKYTNFWYRIYADNIIICKLRSIIQTQNSKKILKILIMGWIKY